MDTLCSPLFSDASERRVWLSTESKILASTFGRFRLYRLNLRRPFRTVTWVPILPGVSGSLYKQGLESRSSCHVRQIVRFRVKPMIEKIVKYSLFLYYRLVFIHNRYHRWSFIDLFILGSDAWRWRVRQLRSAQLQHKRLHRRQQKYGPRIFVRKKSCLVKKKSTKFSHIAFLQPEALVFFNFHAIMKLASCFYRLIP